MQKLFLTIFDEKLTNQIEEVSALFIRLFKFFCPKKRDLFQIKGQICRVLTSRLVQLFLLFQIVLSASVEFNSRDHSKTTYLNIDSESFILIHFL